MVYRGTVKGGVVRFRKGVKLPEGTKVNVQPAVSRRQRASKRGATLAEKLAPFIGMADDLPADMAKNHDHYLYGNPKRK